MSYRIYNVTNIQWDKEIDGTIAVVRLPSEVNIPIFSDPKVSTEQVEFEIADGLSETFGWLVKSFNYKVAN